MKANELMIGDWVYGLVVDEGNDLNKIIDRMPSKVTMINKYGDLQTQGLFPIDDEEYNGEWEWYDIEPIPLTPEILEKNGFVKCIGGRSKKSLQLIGDGLYVSWWNDRIVIRYKRVLGHPSAYLNCDCRYVHELQHALRLCGIDKEITI